MNREDKLRCGGVVTGWAGCLLLFCAYLSGHGVAINVVIATAFVTAVSTALFLTDRR
jgi:hypothetical protein